MTGSFLSGGHSHRVDTQGRPISPSRQLIVVACLQYRHRGQDCLSGKVLNSVREAPWVDHGPTTCSLGFGYEQPTEKTCPWAAHTRSRLSVVYEIAGERCCCDYALPQHRKSNPVTPMARPVNGRILRRPLKRPQTGRFSGLRRPSRGLQPPGGHRWTGRLLRYYILPNFWMPNRQIPESNKT